MRQILIVLLTIVLLAGCAATPSASEQTPIRIAFRRQGDLWLWEDGQERRLTTGAGVRSPRFSHDGQYLTYHQDREIKVIKTDGTGPWVLEDVHEARWSPTETSLAVTRRNQVWTLHISEDGPQQNPLVAEGWSHPVWTPDGLMLAIARIETGESPFTGTARVGLISREDGEPRILLEEAFSPSSRPGCGRRVYPLAWSPDGNWLLLMRPGFSASAAADCNEFLVLSRKGGIPVELGATANTRWAVWSPTGPVLAFVDGPGRIAWENKQLRLTRPPFTDSTTLTPTGYADREPAWSPDGETLAFTRSLAERPAERDGPSPGQAIYLATLPAASPRKVEGSEGGFAPFWSKDGTLFWFEPGGEIHHTHADLPTPLLKNVDVPFNYYGQWRWQQVITAWGAH